MPSPVGDLGAYLRKKNQFCAKNYAILSKFWYFFPILQHKVGDYPPVLKVGDLSPCPPCSDAYAYLYCRAFNVQSCDQQGVGSNPAPARCRVQPWTCASVTKQYNLVPANRR